jgi:glycosyltransferase involved in cell wall biosynthesis
MPPLVSVVIPVYNAADTVVAAVESVLAQSHRDLEVLIVDDGSPDDSIERCRRLNDPRIRILHQANRGLAGARNTGIRHSHGAFVGFLDSDDLWDSTKVERHLEHFRRRPEVGLSFSCSRFIDEAGRPLGILQLGRLTDISPQYLFCRNPIGNGSSVLMRREALEAIGFEANVHGEVERFWFDDTFRQSEDVECWLRLALTTDWRIEGIPDVLTSYRVNTRGLSANVMKQYESWQRVLAKASTYAPDFVRRHGNQARAYQLRYLSRRATQLRMPGLALKLIHRALLLHWQLLIEEPRRTLITLLAAWLLLLLPPPLYRRLEAAMFSFTGASQRRTIERTSRREGATAGTAGGSP